MLLIVIHMHYQHSDQEEGFIASDFEINNKFTSKVASKSAQNQPLQGRFKTNYRFGTSFIKKQHPLALNTPLIVQHDAQTTVVNQNSKKAKNIVSFEHPYKTYCQGDEFSLLYSRSAREPFTTGREYMKNEVSLLNIEDKMSPSIKQMKTHTEQEYHFNADDLHFDSRFENGNLHCAFRRKGTNQYHFFMSNDTNTLGYNQWFYFSVRNMRKGVKYIFNVVNYRKCLEFWKQGQKIAMFSLKNAEKKECGWKRTGNKFMVEESNSRSVPERRQYILSFQLQFQHQNDLVLIASSIPYSYSKLLKSLNEFENEARNSKNVKWTLTSVSTTICNNQVPEVTITGRETTKTDKQKRMIIIMARQHPGQVWSSYVAEGIMRSFMKESPQNQFLLENYIIKIFPMVNVDGVIYGNFRCDISGVDLNRRWRQPSKIFHPQIFDLKKRISTLNKKWKIDLCLDLHGHSKKYNIFCYACKQNSYTCRILPYLIQNESNFFYFPSCTFGLSRDKESTARAAISRILKSQNVLTIQTSTYGWRSNFVPSHFHPLDLYKFGESMMKAVRYFVDKKSSKFKASEKNIKQNFSKFQQYDHDNEEESGSDSEPEQDEIDFRLKVATIMDKKFQNQFKSFVKEDKSAQLHLSQIVFNNESHTQNNDIQKLHSNRYGNETKDMLNFQHSTHLLNTDKELQTIKMPKKIRRNDSPVLQHKKSYSINQADIGRELNVTEIRANVADLKDSKGKLFVTKNILIRQKKKPNVLGDNSRQSQTLNPRQSIKDEVGRSNLFKELYKQQQKQRMQNFVSKFDKFIPTTISQKIKQSPQKNRFQQLEQSLNKEDPICQLNVMLQNKRRIELQRIRKSIEDTTTVAERQGKLKGINRKDPIVDFRRFKLNEKLKIQQKRVLGQFSERYIEHQY